MQEQIKHKIIFEGIVGSQSYNLATENSDIDIKGVYIQSNDDILSNKYIPQINLTADETYYELRRFLELVSVGNPNVLELLYLPERCVLKQTQEWNFIKSKREIFSTKVCYNTFSGYAKRELEKSRGLNKKFNWEKNKTVRKDVIDFCKITRRDDGNIQPMKEYLKDIRTNQESVGLVSIDGFRDAYKVYVGDNYRGIINTEDTNEPRLSIIQKNNNNDWLGVLYFNREEYSTHCKNYSQYLKWLENRNEHRVATNKKHGQSFDSKNILHTVRLIMTAKEIPTEKKINVDRTKDRDYLLSIRNGDVDLKNIIEEWTKEIEDLKMIYDKSDLPESVDVEIINKIELNIRRNEL